MVTVRAARMAMATRFEVVLNGEKESWLQSVAEEVLDEIEKMEAKLSLYNPASQIARTNHQAAVSPVKLDPLVFGLLQRCKTLSEKTNGAFDITMGPLIKCWGFMKGTGECPSEDAIARAMNLVGMQHVHLDPTDYTVRFDKEGIMLDLGRWAKATHSKLPQKYFSILRSKVESSTEEQALSARSGPLLRTMPGISP